MPIDPDSLPSGAARVAGVMGWPVHHSRSPRLHGYWLRELRIDGVYIPLPVHPDRLGPALRALVDLGFAGCNLTIPHKEAAVSYMDELSDTADRLGAVNTVIVRDSRLYGDNSDGFGFTAHLEATAPAWPADRPAVVLGAGGAARAICIALIDRGVPAVRIANRTFEKAEVLRHAFGERIQPVPWNTRDQVLADAGLLVNSTSLGMTGQNPLEINLKRFPADGVVYDIVYAPLQTDLLKQAAAHGCRTVDGLGMLLHQARPPFAAWFGVEPTVTDALRAAIVQDLAG